MSSMSLPRVLRRKSRLDSTRNSSSTKHTDSPLLSSNGLQFQHTDPTHSAPSMFLSSTINASQEWSKRILHSIRPSAQDATVIRGLAGDCGDGEVSPGFPPSRPETARRTQQVELRHEAAPRRGTGGRQGPRLAADSGVVDRARRRARQTATMPTVQITPKVHQSPLMQTITPSDDGKKSLFACPFYKLDPGKYHDCRRFGLSRVKDVRQHLHRKHWPPKYCGRCYELFTTAASLEEHRRSVRPCELREGPPPCSISEQQWERLREQYQSRGKPVEDQWMDVWNILFPDRRPPRSVYLDSHLEEAASRLRSLWSRNGTHIISNTLRHTGDLSAADNLDHVTNIFNCLIENFLREFEEEPIGPYTIGSGSGSGSGSGDTSAEATPQPGYSDLSMADDVSTVSTFSGDPAATMNSYDEFVQFAHVPSPSPWQQPHHDFPGAAAAHHRGGPSQAMMSAESLPDDNSIYEPTTKQTQYAIAVDPTGHRVWVNASNSGVVPHGRAYGLAAAPTLLAPNPNPLGHAVVFGSPQPAPPQNRHTWSGPYGDYNMYAERGIRHH